MKLNDDATYDLSRKELFAHTDAWAMRQDFWKTDANDWEDIFAALGEKGFTFDEACDIVESIIGMTAAEHGE